MLSNGTTRFLGGITVKKIAFFLILITFLTTTAEALPTLTENAISIEAPSAILIEKSTGTIIYEKNAHERFAPASVTKIMTMLLIAEEIERGTLAPDDIVATSTRASGMGGSQIWLREGEQMSVREMLKALTVVSANDCAVALAEHISGSEESFVARMNERAAQLGMTNTVFTDCTGLLENESHLTTAYDIALMSRELILHDMIKEYTRIWMEELRDGKTLLSNTNKLIRGFEGASGLKTGFTRKAMYCLSATAERGGVEYIAVVMHAATSDDRFNSARTLLNYAFANYELVSLVPQTPIQPVLVELGDVNSVQPVPDGNCLALVQKGSLSDITVMVTLAEKVKAPVTTGQQLGVLAAFNGEELIAAIPLIAENDVAALSRWQVFTSLFRRLTGKM